MRLLYLFAAAWLLFVVACSHAVTDSDLVGTWTWDPADTHSNEVQKSIKLTITGDHNFVLDAPLAKVTLKGNWVYTPDNKKIGLTPVTITVPSPAGGTMEMKTQDAIAKLKENNADPAVITQVQNISGEQFFDVSDDGKQFEENGAPRMVKSSG